MILQTSKHRQYVKLENIISGIEDIFPRVPIVDNSYSAYQNILNEGRNLLIETARDFTKSLDDKINYLINDIMDRAQYENYKDTIYEEILEQKKEQTKEKNKVNAQMKIDFKNEVNEANYLNLLPEKNIKNYVEVYKLKEVIKGEFINSYSIKNKKPKRLWKWRDRLEYVEGFFKDYNMNEDEKESLKETYDKMKKNYYLKKKHSDIYNALSKYISS